MFGHNDNIKNSPDPSMMNEPQMTSGAVNDMPAITPAPAIPAEPEPEPKSITNPITEPQKTYEEANPTKDEVIAPTSSSLPTPASSLPGNDLLEIKQKALDQLEPLVGKLDQNPEEKFHTTMMMIQANDNQKLLDEAYQAAQNITDDKKRAQALLDVINEVNYFIQQSSN